MVNHRAVPVVGDTSNVFVCLHPPVRSGQDAASSSRSAPSHERYALRFAGFSLQDSSKRSKNESFASQPEELLLAPFA